MEVRLVIRGAAAASKTSQLQVQLRINGGSGSGPEVISNDIIQGKTTTDISVPGSGFSQNFTLSEFFDTPKTGAYLLTASFNGNKSNELPLKILL